MPELTNTEDPGTFSFFANFLGRNISNVPKQIKKPQHYGDTYGFMEAVGVEMLTVALECFKNECDMDGRTFSHDKGNIETYFILVYGFWLYMIFWCSKTDPK